MMLPLFIDFPTMYFTNYLATYCEDITLLQITVCSACSAVFAANSAESIVNNGVVAHSAGQNYGMTPFLNYPKHLFCIMF